MLNPSRSLCRTCTQYRYVPPWHKHTLHSPVAAAKLQAQPSRHGRRGPRQPCASSARPTQATASSPGRPLQDVASSPPRQNKCQGQQQHQTDSESEMGSKHESEHERSCDFDNRSLSAQTLRPISTLTISSVIPRNKLAGSSPHAMHRTPSQTSMGIKLTMTRQPIKRSHRPWQHRDFLEHEPLEYRLPGQGAGLRACYQPGLVKTIPLSVDRRLIEKQGQRLDLQASRWLLQSHEEGVLEVPQC